MLRLWRSPTMKNTSLLVLLGNAKRTPPVGNIHAKKGSVPCLGRNWGYRGETPNCHKSISKYPHERLAVHLPKGCRETVLPAVVIPIGRLLPSIAAPFLSHIRLLTHFYFSGSEKTKRFRQSLPIL